MVTGLLVVLGICLALVLFHGRAHALQYAFFLRYPLLFGGVLLAGPALGAALSAEMLGNLLVLDPAGLGIIAALGWFLASTVVYTGNLIFGLGVDRTGLPLFRVRVPEAPGEAPARQRRISDWIGRHHVALSIGLAAVFALQLVARAQGGRGVALLAAALGVAAGVVVHAVGTRVLRWRGRDVVAVLRELLGALLAPARRLFPAPGGWLATMRRSVLEGYHALDAGPARSHGRAVIFFLLSILIYAASYWLLRASFAQDQIGALGKGVPPLAYLLLLLLVLAWILPGLSFFFDKYRVPVVVPLGLAWVLFTVIPRSDHFFDHRPIRGAAADQAPSCALGPTQATTAWAARNRRPDGARATMVVVAASGGGITAALWSARVLAGLVEDPRFGPPLARSIALVSSASGGGVGAMYFVDAYRPEGPPFAGGALARVVEAAGASSLHETGFALAYADFFRLFVPPPLARRLPDRGWALERSWARWLGGAGAPTLAGWRAGIEAGWRPTQIFNATIAETGERLLLAPVAFPLGRCARGNTAWRARCLDQLYGASDLDVVTAARLSATFPWVTPMSRADTEGDGVSGYHLADGGYSDNFGVVSTIEWLSQVHADANLRTLVDKVLVLQIRASRHVLREPAEEGGWLYSTLGPVLTLLNVRTTSQRNQNDAALAALRALLWNGGVALEAVDFELDIDAPTSWHLTAGESRRITEQWDRNPQILRQRDRLACLWRTASDAWVEDCAVVRPPSLVERGAARSVLEQSQAAPAPAQPVPVPDAGP